MLLTRKKKQELVVRSLTLAGALVHAGLPLPDALEHVARTAAVLLPRRGLHALERVLQSPASFLEQALMRLAKEISEGAMLSRSLAERASIPGYLVEAVAQGEKAGTLPKALMELDGAGADEWYRETGAGVVRMVIGVLKSAIPLSAGSIAFPSLPDGQVAVPFEPPAKDAGGPVRTPDQDIDEFDANVSAALDGIWGDDEYETLKPSTPTWKVHYRIDGKWVVFWGFPAMLMGPFIRRLLVMARIPYWTTQPREGVIRLRTGKELREFRVAFDPAAPRVIIDLLPAS